jgi:hypothetical protein
MTPRSSLNKRILILLLVVTAGCNPTMRIAVDGNNPPTIKVSQGNVQFLKVAGEDVVAWEIERAGSKDSVTSITYGKLPPGFKEKAPAIPLVDGREYLVWAFTGLPEHTPGEIRVTVGKPSDGRR